MATEKPKRARYTQEDKDKAYKLFDQDLTMADISRQTGVSEMTLAAWKRDREIEAEQEKEQTALQRLETMELELRLERLQNKFLRRYGKAETTPEEKLELEINYLIEFAKVFAGDWEVKRLSEAAAAEEQGDT